MKSELQICARSDHGVINEPLFNYPSRHWGSARHRQSTGNVSSLGTTMGASTSTSTTASGGTSGAGSSGVKGLVKKAAPSTIVSVAARYEHLWVGCGMARHALPYRRS